MKKLLVCLCCVLINCTVVMNVHDKIKRIETYDKENCKYVITYMNLENYIAAPCGCANVGDSLGTLFKNISQIEKDSLK